MGAKTLLTNVEIEEALREAPGWALRDGRLEREWTLPSFTEALGFVNRVGTLAERADHHPEIDIHYCRVRLTLISHDVSGLTRRDARMAAELSRAFPN